MKNTVLRLTAAAAALGLAAGLYAAPTHARVNSAPPAAGSPSAAVTDPQIAAIVVAANAVDIEAGKLALTKTRNRKVRAFAEEMIRDHTAVNKAASDLVAKLGVTPEENDTSRGLTSSGEQTRARLGGLSGKEFDRAYIDNEVAYHRLVLDAVDKTLVPSAQNAELKATLVNVRPTIAAHLRHAEQLQASLGGKKAAATTHKHGK